MWSVDRRKRPEPGRDESGAQSQEAVTASPQSEGALAQAPARQVEEPEQQLTEQLSGPVSLVDAFADEHTSWRDELSKIGGRNPLLHFDDSLYNRIELSTTHPGGLPQFISGNKILLSALIRDDLALRQARAAAARVTDKAIEMRTVRGLETVNLGVGIAKWSFEGDDFCAPVLLRPLAIRRYGRDFELKLKQFPVVNSELIRALREQFGITVDARTLIELSQSEGVFKPQPVIDRLRQMVAGVSGFVVQPRLVVSSFHNVSERMVADMGRLDSPIFAAVCGSEPAQRQLKEAYHPVSATVADERSPETDRALYDADAEQEDVLAQIDAGHSLVVSTLPGTGGTQTVVNAIGNLVRAGKRVLVVSPRRATLDGITHRLTRAGLAGLAVTPRRLRRNLVEAISRNENASLENLDMRQFDEALVRLRSVLVGYRGALQQTDTRFGASPLDALRALAQLTRGDEPPLTTVRLGGQALSQLAIDRTAVAEELTEVARLGQFEYGPEDSPWYGVDFKTTEEAKAAYNVAVDLAESQLPNLISMGNAAIGKTPLRPYQSVTELGAYLRLFMDIGETDDKFLPEVFERDLKEVISAHAPRGSKEDDVNMTSANRRRLKKLAREYVRPGVHIADMYERLKAISLQRQLWNRCSTVPGVRPATPGGIDEITAAYHKAYDDLAKIDSVLGVVGESNKLKNQSLANLQAKMFDLSRESEVLKNIQERTAIVERLRAAQLEPLLDDLSARHVPADKVSAELELSWWQSALERMLATNPTLINANLSKIESFETDFRLIDDAHAGANGALLANELADAWRVAILDHKQEGLALRSALRSGYASASALMKHAPNLMRVLAPVWMMSPYEVSQLPENEQFDAVLLVDAGATTFVENIGAIRRASQVVAFGDTMTQTPSAFEISVGSSDDAAVAVDPEELHANSAFELLSGVLPQLTLTRSYRAGGEDLTNLVNSRFYDDAIQSLPWAGSFLGHSSLTYDFVSGGQGLPDRESGAVESTDAEVERVVQLVLEHASERSSESLMVITASERHSVRVYQSVLRAFSKFPQYRDFLLGERAEPFAVLTLEQATAQSRDRVIFSIGYGRTPHGRVLSNFGSLGQPGGERLLAVAMTRARRAMTIVSCFKPEDLDTARIKHGVVELSELLAFEHPEPEAPSLPAEHDPLVAELAEQLQAHGLRVVLDYRGEIPLAASYGERAIAVDFDLGDTSDSLRNALRLRPAVLRRLGWHYHRVHRFALFSQTEAVAARIARTLGVEVAEAESDAAQPGSFALNNQGAAGAGAAPGAAAVDAMDTQAL